MVTLDQAESNGMKLEEEIWVNYQSRLVCVCVGKWNCELPFTGLFHLTSSVLQPPLNRYKQYKLREKMAINVLNNNELYYGKYIERNLFSIYSNLLSP